MQLKTSMQLKNTPIFCSWSGGKDSCLSLYYAMQAGGQPKKLLTMFTEAGERSRSHGLPIEVIEAQASALGVPLVTGNASWQNYEAVFIDILRQLKAEGIEVGVFGDIDLEDHLYWVQRVCGSVDVSAHHPLWKKPRREVLVELIDAGFKAIIVAVKDGVLDAEFLGKTLDYPVMQAIEALGIDACGEEGEFHTVVTDGPIFQQPILLEMKEKVLIDGYWFQDLALKR